MKNKFEDVDLLRGDGETSHNRIPSRIDPRIGRHQASTGIMGCSSILA